VIIVQARPASMFLFEFLDYIYTEIAGIKLPDIYSEGLCELVILSRCGGIMIFWCCVVSFLCGNTNGIMGCWCVLVVFVFVCGTLFDNGDDARCD